MGERGELPLASPSPVPGHLFKIGVTSINSSTPGGGMTCSFHKTCRQIIITGFRNLILSTLGGFTYIRHGGYCGGWIWGLWGCWCVVGRKQASKLESFLSAGLSHFCIAQHFTRCLQMLHCFGKEKRGNTQCNEIYAMHWSNKFSCFAQKRQEW